jgi:hypothetical protein
MLKFDIVIIGSSPIALLEAAYWQSLGKHTCIIEKNKIGGNWRSCSMFGYKNVEIGPHIFFGHKDGFKFLEKLGIKTYSSSIWNFDLQNKILHKSNYLLRYFFSNLKLSHFSLSKICELFIIIKNMIKNSIVNRIGYNRGGCYDLLSSIQDLEIFDKVTLFHGVCKKIKFKNDEIFLTTDKGIIVCSKVITTQSSDIDYFGIAYNQKYINKEEISTNKLNSAQVTIVVKNSNKRLNFTKFQLNNQCLAGTINLTNVKKDLKYIADITEIVKFQNPNYNYDSNIKILSLALEGSSYDIDKPNPKIIDLFNYLKNIKIVSDDAELVDFNIHLVNSNILSLNSVKSINSFFTGKIICLTTDSLIDSIAVNYHKYSEKINFQRKSRSVVRTTFKLYGD